MREELRRIGRLMFGLFLYAVGIVLTVQAELGLSPWDVFHQGLAIQTGMTFGVASIVVSAAIIALSLLLKERIGFGTLANMLVIGLVIDLLLYYEVIPSAAGMVSGLLMALSGLFVIAFATFFYISAGYGAGPRDSLMVSLTKFSGKPVGLCRAVVEAIALICGWLLGGKVGIGTVLAVLGAGFAIQVVFSAMKFDVQTIRHESLFETYRRFVSYRNAR